MPFLKTEVFRQAERRMGNPYAFVCPVLTQEAYAGAKTKTRIVSQLAANGVDYKSVSEQKSVNGGAYQTKSKSDFAYDKQGNEICGKVGRGMVEMGWAGVTIKSASSG